MTDAEILKALECCMQDDAPLEVACYHCPIKQGRPNCVRKLLSNSLDLINSQKAEIERLQKENERFADIGKMYSEIKSEVRKEFAERLKEKACTHNCRYMGNVYDVNAVEVKDIDNLLKEMEGD